MKPPIHSRKHLVQFPFDSIATGLAQNIVLAVAVNATVANSAFEVAEGSVIKAVFVELWLQNSANDGHQVVVVQKNTDGDTGCTFAELAALDAYTVKKNILHTHEGLSSNDGVGNPQAVIRQWIKIPKSKQRFGLGDQLNMNISNPSSNNLNRCGIAIYKEYT